MRAGSLRHWITIEQPGGPDGSGQPGPWTEFASMHAEIDPYVPRKAGEVIQNKMLQTPLTNRVHIRYIDGITPNMRIKFGTRIMKIDMIADALNLHRELELFCTEVQ